MTIAGDKPKIDIPAAEAQTAEAVKEKKPIFKEEVRLTRLSDETITNYLLLRNCSVRLEKNYRSGLKKSRRSRRYDSDDEEKDETFLPYNWRKPLSRLPGTSKEKAGKSGMAKDISVYLDKPLNCEETRQAYSTLQHKVMDDLEILFPERASDLCLAYWQSLGYRGKKRFLPKTRYSQTIVDPEVRRSREI